MREFSVVGWRASLSRNGTPLRVTPSSNSTVIVCLRASIFVTTPGYHLCVGGRAVRKHSSSLCKTMPQKHSIFYATRVT